MGSNGVLSKGYTYEHLAICNYSSRYIGNHHLRPDHRHIGYGLRIVWNGFRLVLCDWNGGIPSSRLGHL